MMAVDVKRLSEAEKVGPTDRQTAALDKARADSRRQEALLAAAGMDGQKRWAILKVAARRENDVDNALSRAFVEHWLPVKKADENDGGRRRGVPGQPVYTLAWPGYVFVKVVDTAEAWAGLLGLKHVVAVLGVGERPFFVSDQKLLRIKAELATLKEQRRAQAMLLKGQRVMVTEGPFASFPATVDEVDERGQVRVEVMLFGRLVPMLLGLAQLAKG